MEIEIGKSYMRRDGRIAPKIVKIVSDKGNAWYPFVGNDHRLYAANGECENRKGYDLVAVQADESEESQAVL